MNTKAVLDEMIEKYRELVSLRYDYDSLNEKFDLNPRVSKELTDKVKNYFLNYIYPSKEDREVLNKAFDDLDHHIKNPSHILKLLGDAPGIMLKFGWQFPKALRAGFQTLKSFKAASRFEKDLVHIAKKKKIKLPITDKVFEEIIAELPEEDLREFINDMEDLLTSLTDSKLLKRTTEILKELKSKMEKEKAFYSDEEIDALQIGIDILENGYLLFEKMNNHEKNEMIQLIMQAENQFIDELNGKYH